MSLLDCLNDTITEYVSLLVTNRRILLNSLDWNLLMLLRDRITTGVQHQQSKDSKVLFMWEDNQERVKLEIVIKKTVM